MARADGYDSITLTSRIQTTAYRAKADETVALITGDQARRASAASTAQTLLADRASAAAVEAVRQGRDPALPGLLTDAAAEADSDRERAAVAEMLVRWQRYRDTNRTIQTAATRGDRTTATLIATTTGNQAFNGFNLAVESVVQDNTAQFEDSLSSADHRLRYLGASALLIPLVALLLMLWGTQMRINEYR